MAQTVRLCEYRKIRLTDAERTKARRQSEQAPAEEREATYRHLLTARFIELVGSRSTVAYAEGEVHERALSMARALEQRLQSDGLDIEGYCKALGTTEEGIVRDFEPMAKTQLRDRAVLLAIAKKEGLEASQAEYAAEVQRLADQYAVGVEDIMSLMAMGEGESVRTDIAVSKAAAFVAALAAE